MRLTLTQLLNSFGRPGVDCHVEHENEYPVIQLLFLVNEVRIVLIDCEQFVELCAL